MQSNRVAAREVVVEPKEYAEFTPGVLRGVVDVEHWKTLVLSMPELLAACRCDRGKPCAPSSQFVSSLEFQTIRNPGQFIFQRNCVAGSH